MFAHILEVTTGVQSHSPTRIRGPSAYQFNALPLDYCFTQGSYEFSQNSGDFREIPKFMMLPFHNFTRLNKLSSVNLCIWLCRWTSSYARSFRSENHSGHMIICGIVILKIAHWSELG